MEAIEFYCQRVEKLLQNAREQREALTLLNDSLIRQSERLSRYDQFRRLYYLKVYILQQINDAQEDELRASSRFPTGDLINSLASLTVKGVIRATTRQGSKGSFLMRLLDTGQPRERPFGKVMLEIGLKGLPEGVNVVTISRLARKEGISESAVEQAIQAEGYILMIPDDFCNLIDKLETEILDGTITLPISRGQIISELDDHD